MKRISSSLYQISLGTVNVFLIEGKDLTLVDTGTKGSEARIFKAMQKGGKDPQDIKRIILTHSHPDHAGCAASLSGQLNAPLYAHQEDALLVEQGIAGRLQNQVSPGLFHKFVFSFFIKKAPLEISPASVHERLADGDTIPLAGGLEVIHTPGHSAGHIALLLKDEGVLIAGDICAKLIGLGLSTVYEDRELGIQSILKAANYDFDKAVFGHGSPLMQSANRKIKEKFSS